MEKYLKLIGDEEKTLMILKRNMQDLSDRIKYHEDQLRWYKEIVKNNG